MSSSAASAAADAAPNGGENGSRKSGRQHRKSRSSGGHSSSSRSHGDSTGGRTASSRPGGVAKSGMEGLNNLRKENSLATPIRFSNDLPDVPVDPKFIGLPKQPDDLYKYDLFHEPYVEATHAWELHAEPDLGVLLDLIDPNFYEAPNETERPPLDPLDQEITSDKYAQPPKEDSKTRRRQIDSHVDWLRHSPMIHADVFENVYRHADSKQYASNVLSQRLRETEALHGNKTRKERIEDSFEAVGPNAPLEHPTRKDLTPVGVWEVLPDPYMWGLHNVSVTFDTDPEKEGGVENPEAPTEIYRTDPRRSGRNAADVETEVPSRRMRHSVLRTPREDPKSEAEGLRGSLLMPDSEDIPAEHAEPFEEFMDTNEELYLRACRDYNLTVKTFRRRRRDAANRAISEEEARRRGESAEQVDEHLLFRWDDESNVIRFAPMQARIECAKIPMRDHTTDAFRLRRQWLPDEEDEFLERTAGVTEEDPTATKAEISRRRLERRKSARQRKMASSSKPTNRNTPTASSSTPGATDEANVPATDSSQNMPTRISEHELFAGDDEEEM
eukprot:gb/GECG01010480.1/.p1 GENE.gb/GECG01010480.1/~~gb/GECG01010480.1/.p1  ORF type:complete len:558 (+),score=89.52 gb/GECG01010480.1/:1-1674(+)